MSENFPWISLNDFLLGGKVSRGWFVEMRLKWNVLESNKKTLCWKGLVRIRLEFSGKFARNKFYVSIHCASKHQEQKSTRQSVDKKFICLHLLHHHVTSPNICWHFSFPLHQIERKFIALFAALRTSSSSLSYTGRRTNVFEKRRQPDNVRWTSINFCGSINLKYVVGCSKNKTFCMGTYWNEKCGSRPPKKNLGAPAFMTLSLNRPICRGHLQPLPPSDDLALPQKRTRAWSPIVMSTGADVAQRFSHVELGIRRRASFSPQDDDVTKRSVLTGKPVRVQWTSAAGGA